MNSDRSKYWFLVVCLAEGSLFVIAVAVGWVVKKQVLGALLWRAADALLGITGAIPLFMVFYWTMHSSLKPLAETRNFLETVVRPIFDQWRLPQLAAISILAGIGEESLFRAVAQGALGDVIEQMPAMVVASMLFGAFHFVTVGYAVLATLIGLYLGCLWAYSGNLLVPVLTHAVYDFAALVYFLRFCEPQKSA